MVQHDLCVDMRMFHLSKQQCLSLICIFIITFALFVCVGLTGPPITTVVGTTVRNLQNTNSSDYNWDSFIKINTPKLSVYCQQLWVLVKVKLINPLNDPTSGFFTANLTLKGIDSSTNSTSTTKFNSNHKLKCKLSECEDLILVHLGLLPFDHYRIETIFTGLKDFSKAHTIKDIEVYFKSYTPDFSYLQIWLRFIFMLLTFGTTAWFLQGLKPFSYSYWSMEQKWMILMLFLLVLYNNPFYALNFVSFSPIPHILDEIFEINFLCCLILYWLCIYHGIRETNHTFKSFYLPKIAISTFIWVISISLTIMDRHNEINDPNWYGMANEHGGFWILKNLLFFLAIIYGGLLAFYILRAFGELWGLSNYDIRLKTTTILMGFVLIIIALMAHFRFGFNVTMEDNFVSQLSTQYDSSVDYVTVLALLNLYVYVMAYLYSPPYFTLVSDYSEKNDALGMIQDSEEELLFSPEICNTNGFEALKDSDDSSVD